jgi:hypothetical protein
LAQRQSVRGRFENDGPRQIQRSPGQEWPRHTTLNQNTFQTKCPNKKSSNTPPTPQTQIRKFAVIFGESISFLSIVFVRCSCPRLKFNLTGEKLPGNCYSNVPDMSVSA